MAISLTCSHCGAGLKVADKLAGRRGRCPQCRGEVVVPRRPVEANGATPARRKPADDREAKRERIRRAALAALQGEIKRPRRSPLYLLALPLAAAVMLALPLLYLAIVAAAGYAVYYHWTENAAMLDWGVSRRARGLFFLVYVGIGVAGAVVILFLVKPLFARPAREVRTRSLTPKGEPYLFQFVYAMCELVGAPRPTRIDAVYQMNAWARFRRGPLSLFRNDLVLTIGAPLIAGLTIRQFAGVLAHELGHFRQGLGVRLSYLIRRVNDWFARVVYERDVWDEWLAESANDYDIILSWVLSLAELGVFISRLILRLLMTVGDAVCGVLMRQMEYDSDRVAVQIEGSSEYEVRRRKNRLLGFAYGCAEQQVLGFLARKMYPDDIARFTLMIAKEIPQDVREQVNESVDEGRTHWLDTHPCDADRIRSAQREGAEGILHVDAPASVLFDHFEALCRNVTWDLYTLIPGVDVRPQDLQPVHDLLAAEQAGRREQRKALDETPIPLD